MLLRLDGIAKSYGAVEVLAPLSLTVEDGEFLTILGPSGSGKTTILRIVGGFVRPSAGRLSFAGADMTDVPAHKRPFNTVFQDYALFPHMTVARNVGYGLMLRGAGKAESARKVAETLGVVGLQGFEQRYPAQLSGGQRQRVALARALVLEPRLILLDEPLGALDAELRRQMQLFLKGLQRRIRTTFLFVTHDQEEATTMSDRIVVMNHGRVEQIGAPRDIYYRPATRFVAGFFGENNLLDGEVAADGVRTALGAIGLPTGLPVGTPVTLAIRPEKIAIGGPAAAGALGFPAAVEDVVFVGPITQILLRPAADPGRVITAKLTSGAGPRPQPGEEIDAAIDPADVAVIGREP